MFWTVCSICEKSVVSSIIYGSGPWEGVDFKVYRLVKEATRWVLRKGEYTVRHALG